MLWSIITSSESILSDKDKDLILDLVDAECHNATEKFGFILHDIFETQNSSEAIVEGEKCAAENLADVLISNTNYKVIFKIAEILNISEQQ